MKKLLFSLVLSLAAFTSSYASTAYGNFFSISSQPLTSGAPAHFELQNLSHHISLSSDGFSAIVNHSGCFSITVIATGSLATGGTQMVGPWSVGLFQNGVLVPGSVAAASNGTDAADNLITLTTVSSVTIHASKGDVFQVRNTASNGIELIGTITGSVNPLQNTSVSLNFSQVN